MSRWQEEHEIVKKLVSSSNHHVAEHTHTDYQHNESICQQARELVYQLYRFQYPCPCQINIDEQETCLFYRSTPWDIGFQSPPISYPNCQSSLRSYTCRFNWIRMVFNSGEILFLRIQQKQLLFYGEWFDEQLLFACQYFLPSRQIQACYIDHRLVCWTEQGLPCTLLISEKVFLNHQDPHWILPRPNLEILIKNGHVWFYHDGINVLNLVYQQNEETNNNVWQMHISSRLKRRNQIDFNEYEMKN